MADLEILDSLLGNMLHHAEGLCVGIKAIRERTITVLDIRFARYAAEKKGKTLDAYIQEKARDMRFTPIIPNKL